MSNEHIINELKIKKKDVVESFNKISYNMIIHLGKEFKDSVFYKNRVMISNFFKFKPNEIIIKFLELIYENDDFRKQIKTGNEKFFMEQSYDTAIDAGYETRIFEFKDIWLRMTDNTKSIVMDSMRMLVDHCELYIDIISQINKLGKN